MPAHYQARQRYLELAVFPEDTDISVTTLQIYWQGTGGLKEWEVEELCLHLSDLSLVLPWNPEHATVRLHDVLRRYLIQRAGEQLPAWHERLLETYHHHYHLARWADLPQSETYLWKRLVSHLCQASNQEALQTTLTDLLYVTRAVQYQGVAALEADLVLATTSSLEKGAGKPSADLVSLHRRIGGVHHLLQQVSNEAEIGGLVLCSLHEDATLLPQRQALEQALPRPFLTTWHPLPQASSSVLRTLSGHTDAVNACAFSPDGKWIVSASSDCTLKVWEAATGAEVRTLRGHTHWVKACAFSPDGKWIVSASDDRTLKVWEAATRAGVRTLRGHTSSVLACGFSPDGKWIVSASDDQTLKVWEVQRGQCVLTYPVDGELLGCAFHPDGEHLVTCGKGGMYFLRLVH